MSKLKWYLLCVVLLLIILAFLSPGLMHAKSINLESQNQNSISQFANLADGTTPTPTPFQPLPPTPTYFPKVKSRPRNTNNNSTDPSSGAAKSIPTDGRINVLLLGSDKRPFEGGFRTDTIILVSLDPAKGQASLVSFPRDLYVTIPGWTEQRINTAMGYGGFPLLASTLEYNFGVRPTYYVMVNFSAFKQSIDSLGGIDVNAAKMLRDKRSGYGYFTVHPGQHHMDGETALWYARSRYSTNDFDRTRRQQEVILALFERVISLNGIEKASQLYDIYSQNVTTNLTWQEIASLLPLAVQLSDTSHIHHYFIGPAQVVSWRTPGGAQVLLPNMGAIQAVLWEALYGK